METLAQWVEREYRYAATAMLKSISRVDLVKERPGFGHTIRPRPGSIIASPVLASWDPEPDYFFHWYRDSAVVIDALRMLYEAGSVGPEALVHVRDFVLFSLSLHKLRGSALVAEPGWRAKVVAEFEQYVRDDAELAAIGDDTVIADTRVNPDGTLDISKWSRPQHDGPPLRALALLRWVRDGQFDSDFSAEISQLIRADLAFTLNHWAEPSFDIWEEERGQHYYTLCVSAGALSEGADFLDSCGEHAQAQSCRTTGEAILHVLDGFWLPERGYYRSRMSASGAESPKDLDISVILAAVHTAGISGAHGAHDPKMLATLARLETLFDEAYPINQVRPPERGAAMGRYAGDAYFSGGAYYFSTLGAAELCFRVAAGHEDAATWVRKGDAFLATVRAFTPPGGELSEQFDQRTGSQTSARHLAWSYAAFISCITARRGVTGQAVAGPSVAGSR
jgi:glucoamylase